MEDQAQALIDQTSITWYSLFNCICINYANNFFILPYSGKLIMSRQIGFGTGISIISRFIIISEDKSDQK